MFFQLLIQVVVCSLRCPMWACSSVWKCHCQKCSDGNGGASERRDTRTLSCRQARAHQPASSSRAEVGMKMRRRGSQNAAGFLLA